MKNLVDLAARAAQRWPDHTALLFDATGESLTFAGFDARTNAMARALTALGIGRGDRVIVMSGNRAAFPLAWFAIIKARAMMVPINIAYRADDARHLAELAEAKAIICDAERSAMARSLLDVSSPGAVLICPGGDGGAAIDFDHFADDVPQGASDSAAAGDEPVNIQFTSGTSGLPKGCVLSHDYWLNLAGSVRSGVVDLEPGETMLTAQAFSYLDPQWAFVLTLSCGARLVALERFRPSELWDKIAAYEATFFYCLAAMPRMLLSGPPRPAEREHRLKVVMCSAIPAERHAEIEDRFGAPWLEAYGTTETGSSLGVSWLDHDVTRGSGTIGKPLPPHEARIVDRAFEDVPRGKIGELLISGPAIMLGYWRNPEATAAVFHDGWYRTGDLARQDDDGFFYLVGRSRDMIRRAGENIAAAEIENALHLHPNVLVAACVAVPDPVRNEEVKAFLIVSDPVEVPELVAFLEQRLARFKIPRFWTIVDELPMTPSERVAKAKLSLDLGDGVVDRTRIEAAG